MIRESGLETKRGGVEGAMYKRLPNQELWQEGSFHRTEMNWAEDHASLRLSSGRCFLLKDMNWNIASTDNLDDVFVNAFSCLI
jgi:hypothetical protein